MGNSCELGNIENCEEYSTEISSDAYLITCKKCKNGYVRNETKLYCTKN